MPQCIKTTLKGNQCQRQVEHQDKLCWQHSNKTIHRKVPAKLKLNHLEDRIFDDLDTDEEIIKSATISPRRSGIAELNHLENSTHFKEDMESIYYGEHCSYHNHNTGQFSPTLNCKI